MENVFQELPIGQWPILMEKLKALWPLNISGYYSICQHLKYPRLRKTFQFKVYCPFGNVDNGAIATCKKGERSFLIIYCVSEDTDKLEYALLNTNLIDWNGQVQIDIPSSLVVRTMENVKPKLEASLIVIYSVKVFYLDKSAKPFEDLKCPPDTYLADIKRDHIKMIDKFWKFYYTDSHIIFSELVSEGLSYGLYSRDKLLAWVFVNEYGVLNHLFCDRNQRRKGYAEFLVKTVANDRLSRGEDVHCFVWPDNVASTSLFLKLGFEQFDNIIWDF